MYPTSGKWAAKRMASWNVGGRCLKLNSELQNLAVSPFMTEHDVKMILFPGPVRLCNAACLDQFDLRSLDWVKIPATNICPSNRVEDSLRLELGKVQRPNWLLFGLEPGLTVDAFASSHPRPCKLEPNDF